MFLWKIDLHIAETLKKLPSTPGVYLFRSLEKTVLYVGRATSLRSRVASYFSGRDSRGERIFQMVALAQSIETIETETVLESVIFEANLIKKYRPKYNVDLKDDKSFSYFAVTKEEFPRILIVRETFLFSSPAKGRAGRGFTDHTPPTRGLITSPWQGRKGERTEYSRVYGPYPSKQSMETVLKILRKIFPFHSASQKTEKGCLYRQIGLCPGPYDGGITKEEYRNNIRSIEYVLRGQKKRLLTTLEKEMHAEAKLENFEKAKILRGQLFAMRHIREIALLTNNQQPTTYDGEFGFEKSRELCVVGRRSLRIEAYDISNISGEYAVASMVVFENGEPTKRIHPMDSSWHAIKSEYRKFKIKSVKGANDVAMMREVLARRVRHSDWPTPNLIILDGGKGHLNMAVSLWKALDIHIPLAGVAKGPTRKKVDVYTDPEFAPDPTLLADPLLLERIREEAHRFAIAYHRKLRGRAFLEH